MLHTEGDGPLSFLAFHYPSPSSFSITHLLLHYPSPSLLSIILLANFKNPKGDHGGQKWASFNNNMSSLAHVWTDWLAPNIT
jgi:hypothetical protein